MRATILLVVSLLIASAPSAQSGEVLYRVSRPIAAEFPAAAAPDGAVFPTEEVTVRSLTFADAKGWTVVTDAPLADQAGGTTLGPSATTTFSTYVDADADLWIREIVLFGRTFLIEESVPVVRWRLTGEEGSFIGHRVQRATASVEGREVEAWFTPDIPVPLGPDKYGGLPGLVLVLTEGGGARFEATAVSLRAEGEAAPVPDRPTDGQTVSAEEYRRIMRERIEALQNYRGPAGTVVVPVN